IGHEVAHHAHGRAGEAINRGEESIYDRRCAHQCRGDPEARYWLPAPMRASSSARPAVIAISLVTPVMHRWSIGQMRFMHGPQSTLTISERSLRTSVAVHIGSVGPKMVTTGVPKAFAKWRGPVSLV